MFASQKAFPLQANGCHQCYKVPFQQKWLVQSETEAMETFPGVKRHGRYIYRDSFYIGTNSEPLYDERLMSWADWNNKITQVWSKLFCYHYS